MLGRRGWGSRTSPALTKLSQKILRWNIEGIVLENAADYDHGVRPHNVNHGVTAKFPEMVSANDCVVVATPHIVYAGLELNYVVDVRLIFNRPVHATANSTQRELSAGVAAGQLLKDCDHTIRIEAAIWKVDVCVDANLQLSAQFRGRRVDSYGSQTSEMVWTLIGINHMNGFMAAVEPISYERKQDPVLFVIAVEESADMTSFIEQGTGKRDRSGCPLHGISPIG
jgi:hypothetical protein